MNNRVATMAILVIASLLASPVVVADDTQDIPTNAQNTGAHDSLVAALSHAGLVSALQADGPFTVAPVTMHLQPQESSLHIRYRRGERYPQRHTAVSRHEWRERFFKLPLMKCLPKHHQDDWRSPYPTVCHGKRCNSHLSRRDGFERNHPCNREGIDASADLETFLQVQGTESTLDEL